MVNRVFGSLTCTAPIALPSVAGLCIEDRTRGNGQDSETDGSFHHSASKDDCMAKSTCSVTRPEFLNDAKPVEITINGIPMTADVKEFSTGSLGWYLNGKTNVKVGQCADRHEPHDCRLQGVAEGNARTPRRPISVTRLSKLFVTSIPPR